MKICVSSSGKDTGSLVDPAFGRAPYLLIIDAETGNLEVVDNSATATGHGAGITAAQIIADKAVDVVLTGYVGANAFNVLHTAGIRIFEGLTDRITVEKALEEFKDNAYTETTSPPKGPGCGRGSGRGMGRGNGEGQCRRR
jgi:predicted Fe-Mo cluster-binding NifX family protein